MDRQGVEVEFGKTRQLDRRSMLEQSLLGAVAISAAVGGIASVTALATERQARRGPQLEAKQGVGTPALIVRRVVAANNARGKSVLMSDESISTELWRSSAEALLGSGQAGEALLPSTRNTIDPPVGGSRLFVATVSHTTPDSEVRGFHRTSTLDYVYVLNGELTLLLDEGEVRLKATDMVVLCNAWHSWRNTSDTPVRMLVTMIRVDQAK